MKKVLSITEQITGDAPLVRVALTLALPAMGMMYLIASFSFVDTAFAGRLGAKTLAGISTGSFVLWGILGLANLISIGTGAVIARRIGEGDRREAERVAYQGLVTSMLVSFFFAAIFWCLSPWIFRDLMQASREVASEGLPYLRIILLGTPMIFLAGTSAQIFQSLGDTSRPMRMMFVVLLITLVLDYGLMFGRLGMPNLGIRGAAVAFVASRAAFSIVAVWLLCSRRRGDFVVRPHGSPWIDWSLFRRISTIGLPTCMEGVLFPVVYMLLTRYTTAHGTCEVAALRVGHTIEGLTFFGALGMGIAMRPLVGQNLGAGKPERASRAAWIGSLLIFGPVLAFSGLLIVSPETVVGLLTDDPGVIVAGARYLRIVGWSQVFMAVELVFVGAFSGAGDTWTPMVIVVPITIARWPIAALTQSLGMGIEGVWWAISGTSMVKGVLIAWAFSRGGWKRKRV